MLIRRHGDFCFRKVVEINILSKLYNGEINPVASMAENDPEYHDLLEKQALALEPLFQALTPEQKTLFEQYREKENLSNAHLLERSFRKGFAIGAEIILELKGG